MGYRSHGVVALDKELYDEFQMLQIKLPEILSDMCFEPYEDHVLWEYAGFKMYDGYSDVDELMQFLSFLDGSESWAGMEECPERWCDNYQYVRIGEETNDIEERGDKFWYTVCRSVERY